MKKILAWLAVLLFPLVAMSTEINLSNLNVRVHTPVQDWEPATKAYADGSSAAPNYASVSNAAVYASNGVVTIQGVTNNFVVTNTTGFTQPINVGTAISPSNAVTLDQLNRAIGGISVLYASTNTSLGIAGYYDARTFLPTHSNSTIAVPGIVTGQYLTNWISNTGIVTEIRSGIAVITARMRIDSITGGKAATVKPELYIRYSDGSIPELFEASSSVALTASFADYTCNIDCPTNVMVPSDARIVVKWKCVTANNAPQWEFQCGSNLVIALRIPAVSPLAVNSMYAITAGYATNAGYAAVAGTASNVSASVTNGFLPLAGGTMTGTLDMGGRNVQNALGFKVGASGGSLTKAAGGSVNDAITIDPLSSVLLALYGNRGDVAITLTNTFVISDYNTYEPYFIVSNKTLYGNGSGLTGLQYAAGSSYATNAGTAGSASGLVSWTSLPATATNFVLGITTNYNGTNSLADGTVNSNKLDAATKALLGSGSGTIADGSITTNKLAGAAHDMYWKTNVSFFAYMLSQTQTLAASADQVVTNNAELYDHGAGYNTSDGTYTTPIGGLYIFHAALFFDAGSNPTYLRLETNNVAVPGTYRWHTIAGIIADGTTCVIEIPINTVVRVIAFSNSGTTLKSINYQSFQGALLYPTGTGGTP